VTRWLSGSTSLAEDQAAETLYRDWDDFISFWDFSAEHWLHLRTSNPIESVFAGVRLRTTVAKRIAGREKLVDGVLGMRPPAEPEEEVRVA
jgi:transposase-like protein